MGESEGFPHCKYENKGQGVNDVLVRLDTFRSFVYELLSLTYNCMLRGHTLH
jgi:hypothetical protein